MKNIYIQINYNKSHIHVKIYIFQQDIIIFFFFLSAYLNVLSFRSSKYIRAGEYSWYSMNH